MTPIPKPTPRLVDRIAVKRVLEQRGRDFRLAVWLRDGARCRYCARRVRRTFELVPERGEVHHLRGRNVAPQDRFNPDKAVLLCLSCHRQATRREITIR